MQIPETEIIVRKDGAELLRKTVQPGDYVIGRGPECEVQVEADQVSGRHAQLTVNFDHTLIEDLGSSHGTFINGKQITIEYGAPSIRGRKILGELIPINKAWVTGDGAATVLKTPIDLKIGYLHVPAGTYTVYSIITEKGYELIINKQTAPGAEYDPAQDLGRTRLNTNDTDGPIEKLIIDFENTHDKKTEIHIKWGYSESWLHISAD